MRSGTNGQSNANSTVMPGACKGAVPATEGGEDYLSRGRAFQPERHRRGRVFNLAQKEYRN